MSKEKYYLGIITKEEDPLNPMFVVYRDNFEQIANLMDETFKGDPIFSFKEQEISKEQFGELEKLLKKCIKK